MQSHVPVWLWETQREELIVSVAPLREKQQLKQINSLSLYSPDFIQLLPISVRAGAPAIGRFSRTVQNQGASACSLGKAWCSARTCLQWWLACWAISPSHSQHMFHSVTARAAFHHRMAAASLISSRRATDVICTPAYACKLILFPSEWDRVWRITNIQPIYVTNAKGHLFYITRQE